MALRLRAMPQSTRRSARSLAGQSRRTPPRRLRPRPRSPRWQKKSIPIPRPLRRRPPSRRWSLS
ncbi:hypothetical protein DWZ46_00645 [Faecalibacterium prausnitzii]|uniref:Uncharacterized protein n=1 Tax=Faecalibacterium prausnitzii TaxID=853 RepID=A0A3E2UC03_9FIRM|nr:hypothetical protein DWZ46_00645 [Faecalibacterium prausnitzii]